MKKCEFCGKQISYFDQYCDDECHIKANKFYEKGERFGKLFAVINMICVFGIPIGLFMLSFAREVGLTVALASCVILGIMLIILPFPTENMISKLKIRKAVKITRMIGGAGIFLLGVFFSPLSVFKFWFKLNKTKNCVNTIFSKYKGGL